MSRSTERTVSRSAGVTSEMATPVFPARAVLPMRWT
jgi:hypothetical protein